MCLRTISPSLFPGGPFRYFPAGPSAISRRVLPLFPGGPFLYFPAGPSTLSRRPPLGGREGSQGGARDAQSAISTPLWEISTPHWTSHIPHMCPGGVLPTMRQGLYRITRSYNPMEVSPLDLRSLTVLPRALLEVSADPPVRRRRQHNNNNPACINSPL